MVVSILSGQDLTADALSDPTGSVVAFEPISANTTSVTTTETVGITTDTITFKNGRAYRVTLKGLLQSSVGGDSVIARVRKTNLSGAAWLDQLRTYIAANGANAPVYFSNVLTNTTGSDVSAPLVATYQRSSGTGNVLIAASAGNVAYIEVVDAGLASGYPGAASIT